MRASRQADAERAGAPGGHQAPVVAQLLRTEGDGENDWRAVEMTGGDDGRFALALNRVATSFRYA